MDIKDILIKMKKASVYSANIETDIKNKALKNIIDNIQNNTDEIIKNNRLDLENAVKNNVAKPLVERLKFDEKKIKGVVSGLNDLINLEDPVNKVLSKTALDEGLVLTKISVPIGVIGIIFESRPDALVQIASLCIKSGNCCILKGGSEASNTNRILADIIIDSIVKTDKRFENTVYLIETREDVAEILKYDKYINLIIPRGSNEFVRYIQNNSKISVLGHADGICHLYVDEYADVKKAVEITVDSKTQYVAVCNALETLLVNKNIANKFLPVLKKAMDEKNVVLRGDERTRAILKDIEIATEDDWKTEYLDYILSVKIVDDIFDAIAHINTYGSQHTDAIVTTSKANEEIFKNLVDSSSVMINCSTRFSDGFRYGFGAEVGISTNKIHARGPVGLEGLMIYKYILEGDGEIVADYVEGRKKFKHKKII
jgi:glutamate-5-semialdehyde dehydrogenase